MDLARRLIQAGYALRVYDPELDPARFVGQNLGYTYGNLPEIHQLLVAPDSVDTTAFDLIILVNATGAELDAADTPVLNFNSIP